MQRVFSKKSKVNGPPPPPPPPPAAAAAAAAAAGASGAGVEAEGASAPVGMVRPTAARLG